MNEVIELLQQRNSVNKLVAPSPSAQELEEIFKAALRVPDHAKLRPWRFLAIDGVGLSALGDLFVSASRLKNPEITVEQAEKIASKPQRAPLIIIVVARLTDNPKVPEIEQYLSAACAAYAMQLAIESLDYASIWRTGGMAFDEHVNAGLGLAANEKIVGFLYVGTKAGDAKPLPEHDTQTFVAAWP